MLDVGFGMDGLFSLFFIVILGVFVVTIIGGILQWNKNNHSPRLTVSAVVVAKRTSVSRSHHHHTDSIHHSTSTTYYVTFEVQSGDRMEFHISGREYGMIAEGDSGELTFQGTRYIQFNRTV